MSDHHEASPHVGLLNPEHYVEYLIRNESEILLMLRRMRDHRVLLNMFIDGGPQRFVSAVLDAGPRGIVFDAPPDERLKRYATESGTLTAITQLDGVRVQFDVGTAKSVLYDQLPALHTPLTHAILRLQRRNSYRLSVPLHSPVGCVVRHHPQAAEDAAADAPPPEPVIAKPRVVDISMEGIALLFREGEIPLSVGVELPDCKISLPDAESTQVRLQVRNLHHTTTAQGGRTVRAGCQMMDVSPRFSQSIQRYIFRIERERRMMETD